MNFDTVLMVFPVVTSVGFILGVLVVLRYPYQPYSVPLARVALLLGTGFMLWLAWMATGGLFGQPVLDWALVLLCLVSGLVVGWPALFGRGDEVLAWVEEARNGF